MAHRSRDCWNGSVAELAAIALFLFSTGSPAFAQETEATDAAAEEQRQKEPVTNSVFKLDMAEDLNVAKWGKYSAKVETPSGATIVKPGWGFFGDFGLADLDEHQFVRVRVDIVVIGSVDGVDPVDPVEGPDNLAISVSNGLLLVVSNFRTQGDDKLGFADGIGQSFPDKFPAGFHPILTSAKNLGKFGFKQDGTYSFDLIFPHRDIDLKLEFQAGFREKNKEEGWGIAAMEIETLSGPVPRSDQEFADLWTSLQGKIRSWRTRR